MTQTQRTAPIFGMLRAYLRPQIGRVLLLAAVLLGGIGLQLLGPQILRRFIDSVTAHGAPPPLASLWVLAGLFLAATAAAQIARVWAAWLSEQVGWAATNRLRHDLADHVLRLDSAFHNARTPGELIERLDGDVTALAGFFSEFVIQILGGALLIAGVVGLLFAQDWRIGAALGALAFAAVLVLRATRNLSVADVALERQSRSDLTGFLEERVGGLDDIRANGGGGHVMRGLGAITKVLNARSVRAGQVGRAVWVLTAAIFVISALTALSLGIYLFQHGQVSLGAVYLFVQYAAMMREPLNQIGAQLQDVQRAAASLQRIGGLLATRPAVRDGAGVVWPAAAPKLSYEAVDFAYGDGPPVLSQVSFELEPGRVLGLLGRTGGGKTSLIRLLCRLHDPTGGAIRLDGRDIREAGLSQLRRRIGVVTQDVQVFSASVRDNVSLFEPGVADARIVEVLEDLGLGPWLARQPRGLDTTLAGAAGLSAGEGQLLALARIFLKNPGLVVLDEASSRLDPGADRLVELAMDKLLKGPVGRSAIIIAHRLETLRRADRILILEAGRVVEQGDRAALAADPGSRLARLMAAAGDGALP
ncbi:MAG TPA: ABC transporter ATP-binding protein [Caulobacteraceae bacterium]